MRVHLLAHGDVATAVAARLTTRLHAEEDEVRTDVLGRTGAQRALDPSTWPHADLRVAIAWRESAALLEAVDRSAAETRTPTTQAVVTHPRLRVGPVILPGRRGSPGGTGGCRSCLERRQRQHDGGVSRAEALWRRYDQDPSAGPVGYLPHHVSLATALLGRTAAAARTGRLDSERGVVRTAHLLQGTVHSTRLVPVHGCPRCGTPRPGSTWTDLAAELAHLAVAPGSRVPPQSAPSPAPAPTTDRSPTRA